MRRRPRPTSGQMFARARASGATSNRRATDPDSNARGSHLGHHGPRTQTHRSFTNPPSWCNHLENPTIADHADAQEDDLFPGLVRRHEESVRKRLGDRYYRMTLIDAEMDLLEVIELFLGGPYRRFPVLAGTRLVGQISRHDILRAVEAMW